MYIFLRRISRLKIFLNLTKSVLFLSHYLNSKFEAADETMAKIQHQFLEVKMDFKTKNSSEKNVHT